MVGTFIEMEDRMRKSNEDNQKLFNQVNKVAAVTVQIREKSNVLYIATFYFATFMHGRL